jgi:hypothetical protein
MREVIFVEKIDIDVCIHAFIYEINLKHSH